MQLPNTTIDSTVVDPGNATTPASCRVELSTTHPPAGDDVTIWIWLPMDGWNGRFQGTGGGGFSGGSPNNLPGPLRAGYATGATDTGNPAGDGSFALTPDGRLDWQRIRDNAYLGIHEMTVAGKALTEAFYGQAPRYSYFNGCSAGGRQGLMEAQRYPDDYDGIMASAPAINAPKLRAAQLWGPLVMLETGNAVPRCRFEAATAAAVTACDADDGVQDGVIGDPRACTFDPASLVGTPTPCGPITEADATVMRKIWEGARTSTGDFLWYGLTRGASFAGLSDTTTVDGVTTGTPNALTLDWFQYFLLQDPDWDWRTVSQAQWEQLFTQSVEQYNAVTGADNPDLRAFRDRGGKLVMWHGFSDQLVYPEGTIDYYDRVVDAMGGPARTGRFARLFMAPGVAHCGGGAGPAPVDSLGAVVRWVEQGRAPDTLETTGRPLCPYPTVARYRGRGSTQDPQSFRCAREY